MVSRRTIKRFAFAILSVMVVIVVLIAVYMQGGLRRGQRLAEHQLWSHARAELQPYLWLHPRDPAANLLMAESLIKDESYPGQQAVPLALEHLHQIPLDSKYAARALAQEGKIRLLLLDQPSRAEECLLQAIRLDDRLLDAHYTLWKLYDLTGRSQEVGPVFWRVYDLAPVAERGVRLREWYMSEFVPLMANPRLEVAMGFIAPGQNPTPVSEASRLVRFRKAEKDRPLASIALARWFRQEGDLQYARELLREAQRTCQGREDSFFVSTMLAVLIDLGEFEEAKAWWQAWPQPQEGYDYWLWTGVIHEQVHRDDAQAAAAFEKALSVWPGISDWQTRHRYANCLRRLGQPEKADEEMAHSKRIERLFESELHERLHYALNDLQNPGPLKQIVAFYEELGRTREAKCWRDYLDNLSQAHRSSQAAAVTDDSSLIPNPSLPCLENSNVHSLARNMPRVVWVDARLHRQ